MDLILEHGEWLKDTANKLSFCGIDYDDAYQTLAVYMLEGETRWYAWMRTLHSQLHDRNKHAADQLEYTHAEAPRIIDPESLPLEWREEIEHRLSPLERESLMGHLAGYTQEEIAADLGYERSSVSLYLTSAITKLKECNS